MAQWNGTSVWLVFDIGNMEKTLKVIRTREAAQAYAWRTTQATGRHLEVVEREVKAHGGTSY